MTACPMYPHVSTIAISFSLELGDSNTRMWSHVQECKVCPQSTIEHSSPKVCREHNQVLINMQAYSRVETPYKLDMFDCLGHQ